MRYTHHAIDRLGNWDIKGPITLDDAVIVELEVEDKEATKLVVRKSYNDKSDIVLVLKPIDIGYLVITVWLNSKLDTHATLRAERFAA
jgi:hypothetical protein